jgi:peptide/nickel transport system permease protein
MKLLKYKVTIAGGLILAALLILSFLYPVFGPKDFGRMMFIYNDEGTLIGRAPFAPSLDHPFGVDRNGQDILFMLIYGAKYTLIMAFGVTLLRVFFGGILGILLSLWLRRILPAVKDFLLVFQLVPPIVLTLPLISQPMNNHDSINSFLLYQMLILVIVGIPAIITVSTDIIEKLKAETFIQSSYLMGAGHFHVLKTQLNPFLKSYGLLIGLQHFINSLGLIMFLGAFHIYIGGYSIEEVIGLDIPNSFTKEWGGLIGQNFGEFSRAPWIVLAPLFSYFFIIILINMIKKELETRMDPHVLSYAVKRKTGKAEKREVKDLPVSSDFTLQRQHL